jgi:hypothetical protein
VASGQCYSARAAVATESMLVVPTTLTQPGNDKEQVLPMLTVTAALLRTVLKHHCTKAVALLCLHVRSGLIPLPPWLPQRQPFHGARWRRLFWGGLATQAVLVNDTGGLRLN